MGPSPLRRQNARDLGPFSSPRLELEPAQKMQKILQKFQTKALRSKNQHLESEKQNLEMQIQDLENENKEIKSKNEDLESENKDLKKPIQQSADGTKLSRMPRSRFNFRTRILPTSGPDKVEREIIANIATLNREKQDLEEKNKKIEDTIADNIRRIIQDEKDKQYLQASIKTLERKKQDLERQVAVTDRFIDTARQTFDDEKVRRDLMTVIKVLEREKQDLEEHNYSLRMQNQQMNVRLAEGGAGSFRENHVIADSIEDEIRQELEAEQDKRELQTSIKALEQEQQDLERQKQDMVDEKKSLDDKLVDLRKWVERLESKKEELTSSIKDLTSEVQTGVRAEEVEVQSKRLTTEFLPSACNGRNTEPATDKASRHVEVEKLPQDSGNTIDERGVRASLARSAYIQTEPALHNKKPSSQQSLKAKMEQKEKERKDENMDYRRRVGNASAKIDTGLKRARK